MTLAVLVPVLLVALGVAAVVTFALIGFRKWWQMLDAERELSLAPVRLLKEQNNLIAEMIGSTNIWIGDYDDAWGVLNQVTAKLRVLLDMTEGK